MPEKAAIVLISGYAPQPHIRLKSPITSFVISCTETISMRSFFSYQPYFCTNQFSCLFSTFNESHTAKLHDDKGEADRLVELNRTYTEKKRNTTSEHLFQ